MVIGGKLPEQYSRNFERKEDLDYMPVSTSGPLIGLDGRPMVEPGGLKQTMHVFNKSVRENADGLLNLAGQGTLNGEPKSAEEPRPFIPAPEFPVMMYLPDHSHVKAYSEQEQKELEVQGYKVGPWSEKRQIALNSPETEKNALLEQNKMQATVIGLQDAKLQKQDQAIEALQKQMSEFLAAQSKKK